MNRSSFIFVYGLGILLVWFAGNPWSRVNALFLGSSGGAVLASLTFWLAFLVPVVLIGVAGLRGATISRPKLFLFPLGAMALSALAFAYGWLSRTIAGGDPPASGFLPMPFAMVIGLVTAFAPLVLHIVCCAIGASSKPSKAGVVAQ